MDTTYEGWSNVFTWQFNLEFEQDPFLHDHLLEYIGYRLMVYNSHEEGDDTRTYLAKDLEDDYGNVEKCEEISGISLPDTYIRHLLQLTLNKIDWYTIAEHWLTTFQELGGSIDGSTSDT